MYIFFDDALAITRLTGALHPICFHCWNGAENTYGHFYNILVNENGDSPKPYILNLVYNFGMIFDSMREMVLFFMEDSRGQANSVEDAGYDFGLAIFLLISPSIAAYESEAINHELTDYDELNAKEEKLMHVGEFGGWGI